ncbi:MAG: alpha/beta fold hydrolase [Acidobacteria bacterium]|nr:alpha/beta fold hydrolase [Acidobacteriota bacterium]
MRAVYLHGFASTPGASKARFFGERLAAHGTVLECPDLNAPDFSTLTVTRMIGHVEALIDDGPPAPVVLVGSSLGAFVAWFVAARARGHQRRISHLVLLAPAIDFGVNAWNELGAEALAQWRATGWHPFMHYAYGERRQVHYGLYDDKQRYDAAAVEVTTPTLVCMGRRDEVVSPAVVSAFFDGRTHASVRWYYDGHQLLGHLDAMWRDTAAFLGLPASR